MNDFEIVTASRPYVPAHILLNGIESDAFSRHRATAPTIVRSYTDVVLDCGSSILRKDGRIIDGTRYLIDDYSVSIYEECNTINLSSAGRVCIGYNRPGRTNNYYHWLTQCLPAIYSYTKIRRGRRPIIILPSSLNKTERRSIELSGVNADFIIVEPLANYRLGVAEFSNHLTGSADYAPSDLSDELFTTLKAACLKLDPISPHGEKIYISRLDSRNRSMLNDKEVSNLLESRGFTKITLTDRSFDEQIITFANAKIVVAQHGAGLTNIVFANPDCKVVELTYQGNLNPCFINLAQQKGLSYWLEEAPDLIGKAEDGHQQTWNMDVTRLAQLIASL